MTGLDVTAPLAAVVEPPPPGRAAAPVLSGLWFLALAAALICAVTGQDVGYSVAALYLCFVGVGSAVVVYLPGLSTPWRLALSFAASFSLLILLSLTIAEIKWWHPVPTAIVLAVAATGAHLVHLLRTPDLRERSRRGLRWAFSADAHVNPLYLAVVLVAVATCLTTAFADAANPVGYGGLLRSINPLWFVGMGALVVVAALSTRAVRPTLPPALTVSVVGLVLTLTPAIVYGTPRSQSAQKHIGLVELIQHGHGLSSSYAIYNGWGGFFTWIAWLDGVARVTSLLELATFWPVIMMIFTLIAMRCLAGSLLPTRGLQWRAVLVVILANSIGADYFSPQSVGFVLSVVVFAAATSSLPRWLTLSTTFVIAAALAPTHQLSPYLLCGALFWLLVFRVARSWWLLVAAAVPTIAWTIFHHSVLGGYLSLSSIGNASNFTLPSQRAGVQQQFIVKEAILATAAAIAILVVAGAWLVLRRRTRANWGLAITSAVGLGVVAVNAYGNEGIFRAVLFSIPWLAVLSVRAVADLPRTLRTPVAITVPVLLLAGYLVGGLSLDGGTVERRSDLAAYAKILDYAYRHPGRKVMAVSVNSGDTPVAAPTAPANLRFYRLDPILSSSQQPTPTALDRGVIKTTLYLERLDWGVLPNTDIFLLYSPAAAIHDQQYGFATPLTQKLIMQALDYSPMWQPWFASDGTTVLRLDRTAAVRSP